MVWSFRVTIGYLAVLAAIACGRSKVPTPGTEGAPCFANGTCHDPLLCQSQICVAPCRPTDASCWDAGACPLDMVQISAELCIDRHEASVYESPDCTGRRYGASVVDYPSGFPLDVESEGCRGSCNGVAAASVPTVELYACSVAGVIPSSHISWFQAKRACESSGKTLCAIGEWRAACGGPGMTAYPYGQGLEPGRCVDGGTGAAATTGSFPRCEGSVPGLFDMSGNLAEWSLCVSSSCQALGGSHLDADNALECGALLDLNAIATFHDVGFRCCRATR